MSSIKTRLQNARSKFLRRSSATSTATRSITSSAGSERQYHQQQQQHLASTIRKSMSLSKLPEMSSTDVPDDSPPGEQRLVRSEVLGTGVTESRAEPDGSLTSRDGHSRQSAYTRSSTNTTSSARPPSPVVPADVPRACPELTLEEPTPIHPAVQPAELDRSGPAPSLSLSLSSAASSEPTPSDAEPPSPRRASTSARLTPPGIVRRQSLIANTDAKIIKTLLAPDIPQAAIATGPPTSTDYFGGAPTNLAGMLHRKIWVKRPNASATLVQIREDDLVDDVRDMILKKYANSLGRSFDSPDVTLRIVPRDAQKGQDRTLGPDEDMCRTLDAYFPGGQSVNEALIIDVPQKRTPKASPRIPLYYSHHDDSVNHQTEYFPPMPVINPSPAALGGGQHDARIPLPHAPHSIAVLNTGQLPALPSPGGTRRGPLHAHRPKFPRHNTASPTALTGGIPSSATTSRPPNRPRHDSSASEAKNSATSQNPIPTPPASTDPITRQQTLQTSNPPTPRVSSPQPNKRRKKRQPLEPPSLPAGLLDGSVPPINVLIVEDNIINLRVLGAFMQRLKVRWQRAMNGKEAVTKWKAGGFHLVLMDIQLPVMNGLEATKEIRRLERVNSIGVFSSGSSEAPNQRLGVEKQDELIEGDRLGDKGLFKSPVIIVALTASSLQSDRHEALAAGCNDFLTKPVNFVWLERKVKEWGCMQALIDFDGWRRWKDFADKSENNDSTSKLSVSYHSMAPSKKTTSISPTLSAKSPDSANGVKNDDDAKEKERERKSKRRSMGVIPPPALPEEVETPPPETDDGSS
ncbi:Two-component response regulator SSK1p [Neocucurbitaria cava]|uniref:Two-component response regulator SSK1p n=1 Tax=Neocucurbitaria cava TaxID=798079 RepID=A0A9W8YEX9_9PLEO|nr:Two-component response regulator SSK1p [Neocucurbitaria cava]